MKKALIVIDMQIMPFIWKEYGGKSLYQEEKLIQNVKLLIEQAREANAPIFYILYTEKGESPRAENQPLWQVHPELAPQDGDRIIVKYYADSFFGTELESNLKTAVIHNLVICGLQTEYCVDTTCRSAFSHGFETELASDGHSTYDSDELTAIAIISHHNTILQQFAQIKPASEIRMV